MVINLYENTLCSYSYSNSKIACYCFDCNTESHRKANKQTKIVHNHF